MIKYNYSIKRSKRRSICIKISPDNTLQVLAPQRTTIAEIEKFIQSKSSWIDRHYRQNEEKIGRLRDVLSYKTVLVWGEELPLHIGQKNEYGKDFVSVKSISHLKKLFTDNLGEQFMSIFNCLKLRYGFKCGKVTFRNNRSRWGSCSARGDIVFNYKLMMLPKDVQIYVMVHELCHTKVMNHSQKFYLEVERVLPDYRQLQKKLKAFSPVIRLY